MRRVQKYHEWFSQKDDMTVFFAQFGVFYSVSLHLLEVISK